ncbi:MAG: rhodanese-like domain-containing protein [Planctomycetes bacterium]|nr:rhodanese-like domain-containing protein [Planctomycetota bacterium]
MAIATISPKQLFEQIQSGAQVELIDVRTPVEYREVHVTFARNVPLDQLKPDDLIPRVGADGGPRPVYIICRSGGRSKQACEKLVAAGCPRVVNVEGGTLAWDKDGLPVVRGAKAMSLERQVRIAAGSLVLIGSTLGAFVHPYWMGLAAFVGAGLIFAGITDTCGMGMLLARMPWNRVRGTSAGPSCGVG